MKLSVLIVTWNRAELLDQTLRRLCDVIVPDGWDWEVVVVNNCCTDQTDEVLAAFADKLPLVRYFEATPGTTFARNAAVNVATGDFFVWTDDDVLVDRNWLVAYTDAARDFPQTAYFAGRVDPLYSQVPPAWIKRNAELFRSAFAMTVADESIRPLRDAERPVGANMAMRRDVFDDFRFDSRLGRVGDSNIRGEECDLFARLKQAGRPGMWIGTARVQHYIPPERLTLKYIYDYYYGYGQTEERRYGPRGGRMVHDAPLWAIRQYWQYKFLVTCLSWTRSRFWLECVIRMQIALGIVAESREYRSRARNRTVDASPSEQELKQETISAC